MEEPPGPIRFAPSLDKLKRGHDNVDPTSIRDQPHDPVLRVWNRGKITRMMYRENDPEPESSHRGSWTGSWTAGC